MINIQYFRNSSEHCQQKQLSLSDQELVIPSWRARTPSLNRQVLTNENSQVNVKRQTLYPSPRTIWDTPQYHTMLQWQPEEEAPPTTCGFIQDGGMVHEQTNDKVRERPSRCSKKVKSFKKEEDDTNSDDVKRFMSLNKSHNSPNNFQNVQISNIATREKKEDENLKSCLKSEWHPTTQGDLAKQNVNFKVACK